MDHMEGTLYLSIKSNQTGLNQKLLQVQECAHVLMQVSTGSPPCVPYDAPMPHACKQLLNMCPIETMKSWYSFCRSVKVFQRHMNSAFAKMVRKVALGENGGAENMTSKVIFSTQIMSSDFIISSTWYVQAAAGGVKE